MLDYRNSAITIIIYTLKPITILYYDSTGRKQMNYINNLQNENAQLKEQIEESKTVIQNLRDYLSSSKFDDDKYVNVKDVETRLYEALSILRA